MAGQWKVLVGTGILTAAMSGVLLVGAPVVAAEPASSDTRTAATAGRDDTAPDRTDERTSADETDRQSTDPDAADTDTAETDAADTDTADTDATEDGGDEGVDEQEPRGEREVEEATVDEPASENASPVREVRRKVPGKNEIDHTAGEASEKADSVEEMAAPTEESPDPTEDHPPIAAVAVDEGPAPDATPAGRPARMEAARTVETENPEPSPVATDSVPVGDSAAQTPARAPSLLNVVGSLVLNVLVGFIHVIDGPPVLPANSTVTVRTSSLNLPIGADRSVQADWYFPEDADESTRFVYLQHGFLASGPMYSYTAARLAERTNAIVVAPSLTSNFLAPDAAWVGGSTMHRAVAELFVDERAELTESASAAAGYAVKLPDKFVLIGHSAGGTLVTSAAGFMADNGAIDDLLGVVMHDGVEPWGSRLVGEAFAKLRGDDDRPIYLISSQRYFWSRGGDMADKIQLARPGRFNGVGLEGGLHIDYMEGGNPIIQFGEYLVAGFSQRRNIDAAADITAGWVNDLFGGSRVGVYGAPGQRIEVGTPSGAATAVVLPLGRPARPVWPPLLEAILSAVFDFAGNYWFVYEPLRGHELQLTG